MASYIAYSQKVALLLILLLVGVISTSEASNTSSLVSVNDIESDASLIRGELLADLVPGSNGSFPSDFTVSQDGRLLYFVARRGGVFTLLANDTIHQIQALNATNNDVEVIYPRAHTLVEWQHGHKDKNSSSSPSSFMMLMGHDTIYRHDMNDPTSMAILVSSQGVEPAFRTIGPVMQSGNLLFQRETDELGKELYTTTGSPPNDTLLVEDIKIGVGNADPENFVVVDNQIFFVVQLFPTSLKRQLMVVTENGNATATTPPPPQLLEGPIIHVYASTNNIMTAFQNKLYFSAVYASNIYRDFIWISDGTTNGTMAWIDLAGFPETATSSIIEFVYGFNDQYLLMTLGGTRGYDTITLWSSVDGTATGTSLIYQFDSNRFKPGELVEYKESLYFVNAHVFAKASRLFVTNGTQSGTRIVADFTNQGIENLQNFVVCNDHLYFWGDNTTTTTTSSSSSSSTSVVFRTNGVTVTALDIEWTNTTTVNHHEYTTNQTMPPPKVRKGIKMGCHQGALYFSGQQEGITGVEPWRIVLAPEVSVVPTGASQEPPPTTPSSAAPSSSIAAAVTKNAEDPILLKPNEESYNDADLSSSSSPSSSHEDCSFATIVAAISLLLTISKRNG